MFHVKHYERAKNIMMTLVHIPDGSHETFVLIEQDIMYNI